VFAGHKRVFAGCRTPDGRLFTLQSRETRGEIPYEARSMETDGRQTGATIPPRSRSLAGFAVFFSFAGVYFMLALALVADNVTAPYKLAATFIQLFYG